MWVIEWFPNKFFCYSSCLLLWLAQLAYWLLHSAEKCYTYHAQSSSLQRRRWSSQSKCSRSSAFVSHVVSHSSGDCLGVQQAGCVAEISRKRIGNKWKAYWSYNTDTYAYISICSAYMNLYIYIYKCINEEYTFLCNIKYISMCKYVYGERILLSL